MALSDERCAPCREGTPALSSEEASGLLAELGRGWALSTNGHLERDFIFMDFAAALVFANAAGKISDEQGHHPELHLGWGHCRAEIWTHSISGLSRADFVLAAKISRSYFVAV